MKRRTGLAAAAVPLGTLGGCLSSASGSTPFGGETDETRVDRDDGPREPPSDPGEPVAVGGVGSTLDDDPIHRVRLWNLADEARSIGLEVEPGPFEAARELAPEAHAVVELRTRNRYFLTVSVDGEEAGATVTGPLELEGDWFDEPCPGTEIYVGDGTRLSTATLPDGGDCPNGG
ncbi:hypothetical protein [Natronococcus wangiae]|uniref:hypothetical protein n=1 Tax=Natronococcus wangiae TaxID=3068275 RepID=UPI00273E98F6|nr:hypothetical protein [Natronococcus sp. AD5]